MPQFGASASIARVAAVSAIILSSSLPALGCGGFLDVACNVGKAIEKGAQDIGREGGKIVNQARKDVGNGLDAIDPRITQFGRDIDRMRL